MYAKIVSDKGNYFSHIFAIEKGAGWKTRVLVFNPHKDEIEFVPMYDTKKYIVRKVFIVDTQEPKEWTERIKHRGILKKQEKGFAGYDWLINDDNILTAIKKSQPQAPSVLDKIKSLKDVGNFEEWNDVKDKLTADNLMSASFGFHDAYIAEICKTNIEGKDAIKVVFNGCWRCNITLLFLDKADCNNVSAGNSNDYILSSNIIFQDDFVYWIDGDENKIDEETYEYSWIKANTLKWSINTDINNSK